MRITHLLGKAAVITLGASALTFSGLAAPAHGPGPRRIRPGLPREPGPRRGGRRPGRPCRPRPPRHLRSPSSGRSRPGPTRRLEAMRPSGKKKAQSLAAIVPVYVHVMRDAAGNGDVTDSQITAADLGAQQQLRRRRRVRRRGHRLLVHAGRHRPLQQQPVAQRPPVAQTYRSQTRQGGANALNIWLVDFDYLGIATFPWDYSSNPDIDGIRVQYSSLPGRLGHQLQPRRDGHPRGRPLVRALPHVPGRLHEHERRGLGHPGPVQLDQRLPRRAATPARCRAWTRSTTTWTTATTAATPTSPPGQSSRMDQMWTRLPRLTSG